MKKRFLAAAGLTALAVCLSGCQGDQGTAASTDGGEAASASSGASDEDKTLTLWIFLNPESTEDARSVVLKNIVEKYNAENENGYQVVVESMNWDKIETAAIQAAAANTGPDIINFFSDYLQTHIEGCTVQPMTQYAEEFIASMPDYLHTADGLKVGGEIYGLPWETRVYVNWYRKDIYETLPETLDELVEMAAERSDDRGLGFALGLSEGSNASTFMESFIPWIHSAGGELLDPDGRPLFNSDAGVRVLNTMKALYDSGAMNNSVLSMTLDDVQDGFKAGTIYGISVGSHRASTLYNSDLAENFVSAPIPGFESGTPAPALVAGQTLALGKYCKNTDAAFDFITYFFSEEIQIEFLKANSMTVRSSLYDDPDVQALENYDDLVAWNEYASTGTMTVHPDDYAELSVSLVKAAQEVIFNGADPKEQLDSVAAWYNEKHGF